MASLKREPPQMEDKKLKKRRVKGENNPWKYVDKIAEEVLTNLAGLSLIHNSFVKIAGFKIKVFFCRGTLAAFKDKPPVPETLKDLPDLYLLVIGQTPEYEIFKNAKGVSADPFLDVDGGKGLQRSRVATRGRTEQKFELGGYRIKNNQEIIFMIDPRFILHRTSFAEPPATAQSELSTAEAVAARFENHLSPVSSESGTQNGVGSPSQTELETITSMSDNDELQNFDHDWNSFFEGINFDSVQLL